MSMWLTAALLFVMSANCADPSILSKDRDVEMDRVSLSLGGRFNTAIDQGIVIGRFEHAKHKGEVPSFLIVSIAPGKLNYNQKEIVTAVITNHNETSIVGLDMKSYCTMVYLQKLEKDQWVNTATCPLRRAPFPVTIKPEETIKIALEPSTVTPGPNDAGIYRFNFPFSIGTLDGEKSVVTSQAFHIASMAVRRKVND